MVCGRWSTAPVRQTSTPGDPALANAHGAGMMPRTAKHLTNAGGGPLTIGFVLPNWSGRGPRRSAGIRFAGRRERGKSPLRVDSRTRILVLLFVWRLIRAKAVRPGPSDGSAFRSPHHPESWAAGDALHKRFRLRRGTRAPVKTRLSHSACYLVAEPRKAGRSWPPTGTGIITIQALRSGTLGSPPIRNDDKPNTSNVGPVEDLSS
jgi:hypothetical protein